ncbi:MAG: C4-type zinc ribbon domain-containing protein [Aquificota bacterium]|nr:C4-type zinc ribbon domain-containing protein [Aquificota bacterium]
MDPEKVKDLLKLQEVDQEILRIKRRLKRLAQEREDLEARIRELEDEIGGLRDRHRDLISRKNEIKEAIEEEEGKLKLAEKRLMMVKKDAEYKAALREKAKHEDSILKLMVDLDEVEEEISKVEKELKERESYVQKKIKELKDEIEDLNAEEKDVKIRMGELEKKREEVKKGIDESILTVYEELKDRLEAKLVAQIEEGTCSGCGMKVPDVIFSKLIKESSIERCPNCGRYIYYKL